MFDQVIFKDKKFSDILEDIYKDNKKKGGQVDKLINELSPLVQEGNAMMVVPLIKEYLEIGVKNSDNLIKMASIIQRAVARNIDGSTGEMLPDEEKEYLMQLIKDQEKELLQDSKPKLIEVNIGK
jgi:hypothetical protein